MALISGRTIVTSASLFHLTLAYFFLTNPNAINDQALVYILGQSMGIPEVRGFDVQSPALAMVAAILILVALSDLVSLSMPDEVCIMYHWGTQAPLRFAVCLGFIFYTFFFGPSSPMYSTNSASRGRLSHPNSYNPNYQPAGWGGDFLKNSVFFALMFIEVVIWFWAWNTLREERDDIIKKKAREQGHTHTE